MTKNSIIKRLKTAMLQWLARRLPDCRTITPTIGESLDRKLSFRENLIMKLHLFTCEACANYLKEIKFLRRAVRLREENLNDEKNTEFPKMSSDAKERMKNALRST